MSGRVTVATLAERVKNYHDDTKADLCEIKEQLEKINGRTIKHESRISTLEGRQGLLSKITLGAIGGGGALGGAVYAILHKLGIGTGG